MSNRLDKQWADPEHEESGGKGGWGVVLHSNSPVPGNDGVRMPILFRKKDCMMGDWVHYLVRHGGCRFGGECYPLAHFLVHRKFETLDPHIRANMRGPDVREHIIFCTEDGTREECLGYEYLMDYWRIGHGRSR
jgi:hypothetical protein